MTVDTNAQRLLKAEPRITVEKLLFDQTIGTQIFVRDPIDNGKVLREENRAVLFDWCEANCQGRYWVGMGFVRLELDEDIMLFRLRWL
jgi:hypothetical protein